MAIIRRQMPFKIVVTAGPTREPIDPVRFISNRSTGYMGYKIAEVASKRRHSVTLISGPTRLKPPKVRKFILIETAEELLSSLKKEVKRADCLIMCAAVGDFRAKELARRKIKRKKDMSLRLILNKDLLRELSRYKKGKLFIGFSLDTQDIVKNSIKKLKNKHLDIIVANKFTKSHNPFGENKLDVCIIDSSGQKITLYNKYKSHITHVLLDKIEQLWYLKHKSKAL